MKYNSFKEFFWKTAFPRMGLPWGFLAGLIYIIISDADILKYFLRLETLFILGTFTIIGGILMAFGYGKALWKKEQKVNEDKKS